MRIAAAAVLAGLALLAAGCGAAGEDEPPGAAGDDVRQVDFDEAEGADDGTLIEIAAGLYEDDEPMRICRELAESYPPQCGRAIRVVGLSWADVPDVQRASGVTWTDGLVRLVGEMHGGVLHVTELRDARLPHPQTGTDPRAVDGDAPVSYSR